MLFYKKSNKILLLESAKSISSCLAKKYKNRYIYAGNFPAEKLSYDFLDLTDYYMSHYRAGKVIDGIYAQYVGTSKNKIFNEMMDDERAHFFIKKTILSALGELFLSFILAEKFIEKYKITEEIDFIPREFSYTLYQIISTRKDLLPDKVNIPLWYLRKMERSEFLKNSIYHLAFIFYPFALALIMRIGGSKNVNKKSYRFGVYIWNTWISSSNYAGRMDFLEDNDGVNPTNTLYIMESRISKTNLGKIKTTDYPCCYFKEMVRQFNVWSYFRQVYPGARKIAQKMISMKNKTILLSESYLETLRWYILWEIFYSQYNVETFLAVQDPGNIVRVLIQKKHGSNNIFIYLSTSYSSVPWGNLTSYIDLYYAFMIYKALISSRMSGDFFKVNNNFIERYIDCGIVRSDIVFKVKHDDILKARIKKELGLPADKIIIGFFDDTGGRLDTFNDRETCDMVNSVYRLLESNNKYCFIYRSKGNQGLLGSSDVKNEFDRLIEHRRVFYINKLANHYKAYDLMGICDLAIGPFNSSVPQEAVAGGVRAVCYIPSERFSKDIFILNTFPRFCAQGYERLKEYAEYWLHQCDEDGFRNFQDNYIKKYLDSYCDGEASKRLQLALRQYGSGRTRLGQCQKSEEETNAEVYL